MATSTLDIDIHGVLRYGFDYIREDPDVIDEIFANFKESHLENNFGQQEIDKIRQWFTTNDIPILLAWSLNPQRVPCVSVHLAQSTEDVGHAFLGDFAGFTDEDKERDIIIDTFVPLSETNNMIEVPESVDLSLVYVGMVMQDAKCELYQIIDVCPTYFTILQAGEEPDLSKASILSAIDITRKKRGETYFNESVDLGIHGHADQNTVLWLYYIVSWIMLRFKPLLEERCMDLTTWSATDFRRDQQYLGENIFSRWMRVSARTRTTWNEDPLPLLDGLDININVEDEIPIKVLKIITSTLINAEFFTMYSVQLAAVGGTQPYSWSIIQGKLPKGMFLNSTTGVISGSPEEEGEFTFTVKIIDTGNNQQEDTQEFTLEAVSTVWNPSLLGSDAQFWLRGDSPDLVLSNNDPIALFPDDSPNSNDATAFGSACPTYKSSGQNSKPFAQFDGTTNFLTFGNKFGFDVNEPFTILLVGHLINKNAVRFIIGKDDGTTGYGVWSDISTNRTTNRLRSASGERRVDSLRLDTGGTVPNYWVLVYDGSNSTNGFTIYRNGTKDTPTVITNTDPVSMLNTAAFTIGARNGTTEFSDMDFYECILVNRMLSTLEIEQGWNIYAPDKYNL